MHQVTNTVASRSQVEDLSHLTGHMPRAQWPDIGKFRETLAKAIEREKGSVDEIDAKLIDKKVEGELERRDGIRAVSKDFEALMMAQLWEAMKKTVEKNPLFHGGRGEEMFDSMLSTELTKQFTSGDLSFGISDMMEQSFIINDGKGKAEIEGTKHDPIGDSRDAAKSQKGLAGQLGDVSSAQKDREKSSPREKLDEAMRLQAQSRAYGAGVGSMPAAVGAGN